MPLVEFGVFFYVVRGKVLEEAEDGWGDVVPVGVGDDAG